MSIDNEWQRLVAKDEGHQDAVSFLQEVEAVEGVDYDWVIEYAEKRWSEIESEWAAADEKAEGIIKYLGGGTGLLAIALLAKIDQVSPWLIVASLPSMALAVWAIILAVNVKRPRSSASLPSVKTAKICADVKKDKALGTIAGQWNLACYDARLVCQQKTSILDSAYRYYLWAIIALVIPLAVAFFIMHFRTAK